MSAGSSAKERRRTKRWLRWVLAIAFFCGAAWLTAPFAADFAIARTRDAIENRQHDRALTWLSIAKWLPAPPAEWHYLAARVHRRLEHFDLVNTHLKRADELGWPVRELEHENLLAQAQTGQYESMAQHFPTLFMDAGSDGPEVSRAYVLMLLSYFRLEPALEILDAWQHEFPKDPGPHVLRGRILRVIRNWKEAEREYKIALDLDASLTHARLQLADCLMQQLRFEEAEEQLRQCLDADSIRDKKPDSAQAAIKLATCLRKRQSHDEARAVLVENWDRLQDDPAALQERGRIEVAAEQPQDAIKHLRRAVELEPVNRETRYAYAQALRSAGQREEAQRELAFVNEATKPVLKLGKLLPKLVDEPGNTELRFEIAEITWKYKSRAEGAKWFQSLLQVDPDHQKTHLALAAHYDLIGQPDLVKFHQRQAKKNE